MKNLFYDDRAFIAEEFSITEDHIQKISFLTFHKINSFKLSQDNASYCYTRKDLSNLIKGTVLNYVQPYLLLCQLDYFTDEVDN